ncbi:MAG: hypothetical protein FJ222_04950 [Lentisphaerae bacterium]|nr:hypothetical protein [Lentisphaerota bacterium]
MSLTEFQKTVCRILAAERVAQGERYVAGGAALNEILVSARVSHDVDLFHDTREAVLASWESDRKKLVQAGYDVRPLREFPTFVEAEVFRGADGVILQWVHDSAFRFFPLVEHPDFGLALHPFDLATNKVLALIGRAEVRDWVDIIHCHSRLQSFGCLVWAACGKDPGLSPQFILAQASRTAHYTRMDYETLAFAGGAPDLAELGRTWRNMLQEATDITAILPEDHVGQCVLLRGGKLFSGSPDVLKDALTEDTIRFHGGTVRGAWPTLSVGASRGT